MRKRLGESRASISMPLPPNIVPPPRKFMQSLTRHRVGAIGEPSSDQVGNIDLLFIAPRAAGPARCNWQPEMFFRLGRRTFQSAFSVKLRTMPSFSLPPPSLLVLGQFLQFRNCEKQFLKRNRFIYFTKYPNEWDGKPQSL